MSASLRSEECLKLFDVVQTKWLSWKWCYKHAYYVSSPCAVLFASLMSEEVIKCLRLFVVVVAWKWYIMHAYQVSPPCVLQLASLRSNFKQKCLKLFVVVERCNTHAHQVSPQCKFEEWRSSFSFLKKYAVVMETCNRRVNDIIGIHTKFHLYVCYRWKVWGVKK